MNVENVRLLLLLVYMVAVMFLAVLGGYALGWDAAWRRAFALRYRKPEPEPEPEPQPPASDELTISCARLSASLRALQAELEGRAPEPGPGALPDVAEVRVVAHEPMPEVGKGRDEEPSAPTARPWWASGASVETSP